MKTYDPALPRVPLGLAAVAMTIATLGALVVLPSTAPAESRMFDAILTASQPAPAAIGASITPACINVEGIRDARTALVPSLHLPSEVANRG